MWWVDLDWLHDAGLLGRLGRKRLSAILDSLAPVLARQELALPDPKLPDAAYFAGLAAVLRSQPIKAAVYLPPFLAAGPPVPAHDPPAAGAAWPRAPERRRYVLCQGQDAWALVFEGELGCFYNRAGMDFVDYLLKHPGDVIHSLALLARVQGQAPVQQRSAALDDRAATKNYLREMSRLRKLLAGGAASGAAKQVAAEELAQLEASPSSIHHRTMDEAAKAARSVRQAIRRLIGFLAEARDEAGRPDRVLGAFAAHLQEYILRPSQPGSLPAGHLVYEAPEGVAWE